MSNSISQTADEGNSTNVSRMRLPQFNLAQLILWTSVLCFVFAFGGWEGALFLLSVLPPAMLLISIAQWLCRSDRSNSMVRQIRESARSEQVELSDLDVSKITAVLLKKMDRLPETKNAGDEKDLVDRLVVMTEHRLPVSVAKSLVDEAFARFHD